jgi:hypothetical protein
VLSPILLSLPALFFWGLLYFGRHELGWRWIVSLIVLWAGGLVAITHLGWPDVLFISYQAALVIVESFKIFGLDLPRA